MVVPDNSPVVVGGGSVVARRGSLGFKEDSVVIRGGLVVVGRNSVVVEGG